MKKLLVLVLIIGLLLSSFVFAQTYQSLTVSTQEKDAVNAQKDTISNFRVKDIRQDPYPAQPGELLNLYIAMENIGGDVQSPRFEFNDLKYPFSVDASTDNSNYPSLNAGEKIVLHYKIKIDKDASPGSYEVEFRVYANGRYSPSFFEIKVEDVTSTFDTAMQEVTKEGLALAISNTGRNAANALTITIPEQQDFELIGSPSYIIGNLNAGDYTLVSLLVKPKPGAEALKETTLNLQVEYTDSVGTRRSVNKQVPIFMTQEVKKGFTDLTGRIAQTDNANQKSNGSNFFMYAALVLLVLVVIVIIYYRRKLKEVDDIE